MANQEDGIQEPITREEIAAAYGDLKPSQEHSSLGQEQKEDVLRAAMQDINRCTVAITTMFEQEELDNVSLEELRPATGVLVEANGVHGIVTAGHVLGGEDRTIRYDKGRCTIGVMALQDPRTKSTQQPYFRLRNRRCIAYGVKNKNSSGADIAYIPITPREWALLELDGVRGWPALEEPNPEIPRSTKEVVLFDCCVGSNFKASQELQEKHPEVRPAIAYQALQTVELVRERTEDGNWDYTKFTLEGEDKEGSPTAYPGKTPEQTYRDFLDFEWSKLQPQDMLGGLSGTGLWSVRVRVNRKGDMSLHTKRLKGILFYAGPGPDATLHGRKSIRRIVTEGLDLHGQAAVEEIEDLEKKGRRA